MALFGLGYHKLSISVYKVFSCGHSGGARYVWSEAIGLLGFFGGLGFRALGLKILSPKPLNPKPLNP